MEKVGINGLNSKIIRKGTCHNDQWLIQQASITIQSPLYKMCQTMRHSPTDIYTPYDARVYKS